MLADPGLISADTKTYLSVDPGRLLAGATSMWDPTVGAGTVPHQNIGYLFPLGPTHWLLDTVGVPDWIAQRFVWGLLVFAAAWGTCRLGRLLGWSTTMAGVAGFAYGFSPYLLSYLARLSVILFPWAAMPWLIVLAMRLVRRPSWRTAAAFAGLVAVVGSVNATSLVLAGLGPLVFVVADVATRRVPIGRAVRGLAPVLLLSLGVSAWWIAGLVVQGRFGLPILRFTETYRAVAGASTPAEVIRGLGYWFFYGGDRLDRWIGPSSSYTDEGWLILLGFGVAMGSLVGLLVAFPRRGTIVALLAVGLVVSVGAAPIGSSTLYGSWFDSFATESTIGAALRSTTRAAPLVVLALGAGFGALADLGRSRLARWSQARSGRSAGVRIDERAAVVTAVAALALQIFPWFIGTMTTDSILRPDPVPDHVEALAAHLDEHGAGRVLLMPGSDFAYPRSGGTIDPVLPGVLERPVLSRELVPQGAEATADLLNAHERRLHDGWSEPESWPTIARLLGATSVVAVNDHQYERFRLARPGQLWPDFLTTFGRPDHEAEWTTDRTEVDLIDGATYADPDAVRTFPLVAAWRLDDREPSVSDTSVELRPVAGTIIVDGSGDGLVDLAASGLVDLDVLERRAIRYRASLPDPDDAPGPAPWWVITDTNREQGHRWSTLGSNLGPIEPFGVRLDLEEDPGDQRLDVFGDVDVPPARRTVAEHRGEIAVVRSSFTGSRIAYTSEDAPFFATDDDPATAWRTAVFADARGLELRIDLHDPVEAEHLVVVQPINGVVDRFITRVRVVLEGPGGTRSTTVELNDASRRLDGQRVELPDGPAFDTVRLEILDDNLGPLATYAGRPGVGFAEVRIDGVTDDRVVRLPESGTGPADDDRLTYVMTRERIDPATGNRFAPERRLVRAFDLPTARDLALSAEVRLGAEAVDAVLAAAVGWVDPPLADRRVRGTTTTWAGAAVDADPRTAWTTPIGATADATIGATITVPITPEMRPAELHLGVRHDDRHSTPRRLTIAGAGGTATVDVEPAGGRIVVPWPTAVGAPGETTGGRTISVTIDAIDERRADEYASGAPQVLPVAVDELDVVDASGRSLVVTSVDEQRPLATLPCRADLLRIDGNATPLRLHGTVGDLLAGRSVRATTCDGGPISLGPGAHRIDTAPGVGTGLDVDRIVLDSAPASPDPTGAVDAPVGDIERPSATDVRIEIGPIDEPTWLIFGESWNDGWSASIDGVDLGPPMLVNGYANGWILDPSSETRVVELNWGPQAIVRVGLAVSAISGLLVAALLLALPIGRLRRRDRDPEPVAIGDAPNEPATTRPGRRPMIIGLLVAVGVTTAGPIPTAAAIAVAWFARRGSRPWLAPVVVVATIGVTGGWIAVAATLRDYADSPDWPSTFGWTAPLVWTAVATVVAIAASTPPTRDVPAPGCEAR